MSLVRTVSTASRARPCRPIRSRRSAISRRSRQGGRSFADPGSVHIGSERVDILEPAAVRQIPRGRALLIMRAMPPLIVHLRPAWKRPDWTTLHADAANLRQSEIADVRPEITGSQPVGSLR